MAYVTDVINFPLSGELSCKEQHEKYQVERARVSQLVATLTPLAADCHRQHSEYAKKKECTEAILVWTAAKTKYDTYLSRKTACEKYLKAKEDHAALVKKLKTKNADLRATWLEDTERLKSKNAVIETNHAKQIAEYNKSFLAWKKRDTAYRQYQAALASQTASLEASWKATLDKNPFLKGFNWPFRTQQCGQSRQCMTQAKKDSLQSTCNPVRGLGAADATNCMTRQYYPTCPECPPYAGPPGAHPIKPTDPKYHNLPKEPVYERIPTLMEYLNSKGIPIGDCEKVVPAGDPGPAPTCDPSNLTKPTCVAPEIPLMPAEPTCKTGILAQMGPMWLVLAIGAGGLYWYSKGK